LAYFGIAAHIMAFEFGSYFFHDTLFIKFTILLPISQSLMRDMLAQCRALGYL
jgi:hypothetical protein